LHSMPAPCRSGTAARDVAPGGHTSDRSARNCGRLRPGLPRIVYRLHRSRTALDVRGSSSCSFSYSCPRWRVQTHAPRPMSDASPEHEPEHERLGRRVKSAFRFAAGATTIGRR
jgi:hypothetical protein